MHSLLVRDALLFFTGASVGSATRLTLGLGLFGPSRSFLFGLCHSGSFLFYLLILKAILAQFLKNASKI